MKTVYVFLFLSTVAALASAGIIGHSSYATESGRAGELGFVVQLLQLIGSSFGVSSASARNHLSNDEVAAIVAHLHSNSHGHHGQSHSRLSNADTAAIVAGLYANGHGHHSRTSGLSNDVIPAVVAGLYAGGYGHKTHQVSSSAADTLKVTTSHSSGHSSSQSGVSGYRYGGHK